MSLVRSARVAAMVCAGCLGVLLPASAKEAASRDITVESPAQGTIARPGATVWVKVRVAPTLKAHRVSLLVGTWEELISIEDETPPYDLPLQIDRKWSGPMRVSYAALGNRDKLLGSGELVINVVPSEPPVAIAVTDPVSMIPSNDPNRRQHINVRGTYADGMVRDVGRPDLGTSFQSSNPSVVAVDGEGFLTARSPGSAIVTVKNGNLSMVVPVDVQR